MDFGTLARATRRRAGLLGFAGAGVVIATCVLVAVGHELADAAPHTSTAAAATATPTTGAGAAASGSRSSAKINGSTRSSGSSQSGSSQPGTSAATGSATSTPSASASPTPVPAGGGSTSSASSARIDNDTSIVTIGDSIMAGYGLSDPATSAWPERIAAQTGVTVVNDSCSGAGFIAVGDCGVDYDGLIASAAQADPATVIIQSSDNDEGEDPSALAAATTATIENLHAALPNARIIGFSTLWDQPGTVPDEVAQSSDDLQQAVEAVGGSFVDVGQPTAGQSDLLQSDSEHPTDAGQQVLADAFLADLRSAGIAI